MTIPYDINIALPCDQIRELDNIAINELGIPGVVLMENAGRHSAELIYARLDRPDTDRVAILCGPGNNGGDGFVIARHLLNAGIAVDVVLAVPVEKIKGDARTNFDILTKMGCTHLRAFDDCDRDAVHASIDGAGIIVDALLGTGSTGAPRGTIGALIGLANAREAVRIAIDIPSGLDSDSGAIHEPCFRAALTITMLAPKQGFERGRARDVTGEIIPVDIGVPRSLWRNQPGPGLDS